MGAAGRPNPTRIAPVPIKLIAQFRCGICASPWYITTIGIRARLQACRSRPPLEHHLGVHPSLKPGNLFPHVPIAVPDAAQNQEISFPPAPLAV